jgi:hypothetical protein
MKQKILLPIILPLAVVLLAVSCQKKEIALYQDTARIRIMGDSAQQPQGDSVVYSFAVKPSSVTETPINVMAYIIGETAARNRSFKLEVNTDRTTALPAEYVLPSSFIMPAGAIRVAVPVTIKRTDRLMNTTARLTLRLVATDDFKNGPAYTSSFTIAWNNIYTKPVSWSVIQWLVGAYSLNKYKLVIDATGYSDYAAIASAYDLQVYVQGQTQQALNAYNLAHPGAPMTGDDGVTPIGICSTCK